MKDHDLGVRTVRDSRNEASFTLRNRTARLLWQIVYVLLFRPSPWFLHGWRRLLLRAFGATVGKRCHIYRKAEIWAPWNLILGAEAGVANGAILYNQATIAIGPRAVISQGAYLCTGTHDYTSQTFQLTATPISVGAEAWIAAEAFIHPGVSIGAGAVIGARAVVTRDMPNWMVCAGHPCQPLRPRSMDAETPAKTE